MDLSSEGDEVYEERLLATPRQSWVAIIFGFILLLISAGLFYAAYWGWQLHVSL